MYDVCVVGLGYVGLPTACAFASKGFKTVGVDLREDIVDKIGRGESYLTEPGVAKVVKEVVSRGLLSATSDLAAAVGQARAVIVAVQTPFRNGEAELGFLKKAGESVAASLRKGSLVLVESSVPPGTCSKDILPSFSERGFVDGKNFFFAYCPERIAPGNSLFEFVNNDRIVGFEVASSGEKVVELLGAVTQGAIHTTDILTAETVKLVENTARDVYIGFANELSKFCVEIGVDVWDVVRLANTHPRVKILRPGPGVGGPCLSKDPYMLLQAGIARDSNKASLTRLAREVNENMFEDVLTLVHAGLAGAPLGAKIAVLGTSYKPEVGDSRASPSEKVIGSLMAEGYAVSTFDPFCSETFGGTSSKDVKGAVKGAVCAVFMVGHEAFKKIALDELASLMVDGAFVVDAVGVLPVRDGTHPGFRVLRLGGRSAHEVTHPSGSRRRSDERRVTKRSNSSL
ncbi:MAG: nucleotide sugar dehydrogenase [Conexivisphaerales archaeon]|jgi:UDP-N-acetyl-D-mannosaminuronic acid dehydrogenase